MTDTRSFDEILRDLNREAERHRKERDGFRKQAGFWADKRDRLNGMARERVAQASALREQRDGFYAPGAGGRDAYGHQAAGQAVREKMSGLYEEADGYRAQADDAHGKFLVCGKAADAEHRRYTEALQSIRKLKDGLGDG